MLNFFLVLVFVFFALVLHRFFLQCAVIGMCLCICVVVAVPKKTSVMAVFYMFLLMSIVALVSPVDFAIRDSSSCRIKFVKILWVFQHASTDKYIRDNQLVENIDYVKYRGPGNFLRPRWAILITVPTRHKLSTPFELE